jgi:amino acid adenylation domain-containing protein
MKLLPTSLRLPETVPWAVTDTNQSLVERFKAQVRRHGGNIAVSGTSWQPTYAKLNAKANRHAQALIAQGLAPGQCVAVLMRHDAPLIGAVLAVLKAGLTVVVLNPSDPASRLRQIREDAGAEWIVVNKEHRELALQAGFGPERVVGWGEGLDGLADADPGVRVAPAAAAFLVYTSGSSGRPNGVIQTHRHILQTVLRFTNRLAFHPADRFLLLGSLSWGQGVATAFSALLNGAALCPYAAAQKGLSGLAAWLVEQEVTVFIAAASVFRQFIATLEDGQTLPQVRVVRLGAEAARRGDLAACRRHFGEACLFATAYSASEIGNIALHLAEGDPAGADAEDEPLPAGWPAEGIEVVLLDERHEAVAPGQAGQIVVCSPFPAGGYWRNEALAQTRFGFDGTRKLPWMFYTGDLGRWAADGQLEHLGRMDARIKRRGVLIDPAEIEAALRGEPGVQDAMVCAVTDSQGRSQLAAGVIPEPSAVPGSGALRRALGEKWPEAMVPSVFHWLDAFPLTPNGKVDRQRLAAELAARARPRGVAPRTALEAQVAQVWSRVLGDPAPGVYDSFFAAGGDSMAAVDLMLGLSEALGQKVPGHLLLHHPTIAQLAEALEAGFADTGEEAGGRPWQASLLALRPEGSGAPVIFIPGGYASENELLVFAGLLPYLTGDHPVFGVRLNFLARQVSEPESLAGIAGSLVTVLRERVGALASVILVGECRACTLAVATANQLEREWGVAPRLILLDPWHPRDEAAPARQVTHPPAIARYYELLRTSEPGSYAGEVHVVCAEATGRLQACLSWWQGRLGSACHGRTVPGDHHSYLRLYRKRLAEAINDLLIGPDDGTTETDIPVKPQKTA